MVGTLILIIILLLAAMVLIVAEICTPIFGLLVMMAVGAVGWAVYLAYTIEPLFGLVMTIVGVVGLPIYIVAAVRIIPKTSLGKRIYLGRKRADPGEGTPEATALSSLVGRKTAAETDLRPSGTVRVDGKRIVAQAESGMIDKGAEVMIIRAAGTHVVVRVAEA